MITTRFRRSVTLLAIAWYLPFVLTLDLHHNHGFPQPPLPYPAVEQGNPTLQNGAETDICPVLRVSLAHGPLVSQPVVAYWVASHVEIVQPHFAWDDHARHASARDPPVLS